MIGISRRRSLVAAATLACAAFAALATPAAVAAYPDRTIKLIVPFAAGGGTDLFARVTAAKLSELLGQQVVVENRSGAGGSVGAEAAAKAAPDGYTLLLGHTGTLAINPALQAKIPYNPVRDFIPVSLVAETPLVLVVNPAVPANTVQELIALAKAEPGKLNFGSAGNGTGEHLSAELFRNMAGVDIVHVPYNGSAPSNAALLGGQVQLAIGVLPPLVPSIKAGKLRALGVTGSTRSPVLPDVPTIAEAGVAGYESILRYGVLVPTGTPPSIVETLQAAITKAIADPEVRRRLIDAGATPVSTTSAQYDAIRSAELTKWAQIVKASGAAVQ
jgi:tripartite-type tricarboxylate transporter receptor subunit TctC